MSDIEFNLLDEAWIRVRLSDNSVREVSLTDALLHAHEYVDLAGEMPTQDAAVLRLLISIPLTVFYRVDIEGNPAALTTSDAAISRWRSLWTNGGFPEKPIREYLQQWHERFWLFHPERPFWQVPEAKAGTSYNAMKLNAEMAKSNNKDRMFLLRSGKQKTELSYSEAARWLIHIQNWDDAASKTRTGVGWLGQIGYVQAVGHNLFETVMLNMAMLEDGQALWKTCIPRWELSSSPVWGVKDAIANGFVDVLTQPSRRLCLLRSDDSVNGFACKEGFSFQTQNNFSEQMTLWEKRKKEKELIYYEPSRHDVSKQLWREFPSMIDAADGTHVPGVLQWIGLLQRLKILDRKRLICFKTVGIVYSAGQNSSIVDIFEDALSFKMSLLDGLETRWRARIKDEIKWCKDAADSIGDLQKALAVAGGFSYSDKTKGTIEKQAEKIRGDFYFSVDAPFRQWLQEIDAESDDPDEKTAEWQKECRRLALSMGRQMVRTSGSAALLGHRAALTKGKPELYTSAKAYNKFQHEIRKLYPQDREEEGDPDGKTAEN